MVVISASRIGGCLSAFLFLFLLYPFLFVSHHPGWPWLHFKHSHLPTAQFTWVRLIWSLLHHNPAFLHYPSIISSPTPTHSPPPHRSSWPLHLPLCHHASEHSEPPAEWASWLVRQGASQEHWPVPRLAPPQSGAPLFPMLHLEERRLEGEGGADLDTRDSKSHFLARLWNWITDYSQMSS